MSIGDIIGKVKEMWIERGVPREAWDQVSPAFAYTKKMESKYTVGAAPHRMPLRTSAGAFHGGVSLAYAGNFGRQGRIEQFLIPPAQLEDLATWTQYEIRTITADKATDGRDAVNERMFQTAHRVHQTGSGLIWGDSSGMHGKGDGQYSVAGDVITLKNYADQRKFPIGTRLIFASVADKDAADAGTLVNTRPFATTDQTATNGFLQVTDHPAEGQLKVNVNVDAAIPAAVNTDWIGWAGEFESSQPYAQDELGNDIFLVPLQGFRTWNPFSDSEAAKDLYSVKRTNNLDAITGKRVFLEDAGVKPYDIIARMTEAATDRITTPDPRSEFCIYIPSSQQVELVADLGSRQNVQITPTQMAPNGKYATSHSFGVKSYTVQMPGFAANISIIADPWMSDPELTREEDKTYFMVDRNACLMSTDTWGWGWHDPDKRGSMLRQRSSTSSTIDAQYGMIGAFINKNPGHTIIASTRARD